MNKSITIYVKESFAQDVENVRKAFEGFEVVVNGPSFTDPFGRRARLLTVTNIAKEDFNRRKQRKPIRDLKAAGMIRNFGA